jgi:hypothetical protein
MKPFLIVLVSILLAGCAAQPVTPAPATQTSLPSTSQEAQDALVDFLRLLYTKNYAEAAPLYGGEYKSLQVFNTEIDPEDHAALWTWACDNRLLQCLEVRSVAFQELRGDAYIFQVEFSNPDGALFVRGPCCGANETEMPPQSQFEFAVTRNAEGKFQVLNTPPYVP